MSWRSSFDPYVIEECEGSNLFAALCMAIGVLILSVRYLHRGKVK